MQTIISFAGVSILIAVVHEAGHLLAARLFGVRVNTIAVGFGRPILRFRSRETEFVLRLIPFGWSIDLAGTEGTYFPPQADEFVGRPRWQRALILLAGPVANLVLSVMLWSAVLVTQGRSIPQFLRQPAIVAVVTGDSPAARAGVQQGDRITALDGTPTDTWEQLFDALDERLGVVVTFTIVRESEVLHLMVELPPDLNVGIEPDRNPTVSAVVQGSPAERSGIREGDELVAINGQRTIASAQVTQALQDAGLPVEVSVRRANTDIRLQVTPESVDGRQRIGIVLREPRHDFKPGVIESVGLACREAAQQLGLIIGTFVQVVSGVPLRVPWASPLSSELAALESNLAALLDLTARISLGIAFVNLIPLPVVGVDGIKVLLLALEGVFRRDLPTKLKRSVLRVGTAVVLGFGLLGIASDLSRLTWIRQWIVGP